MGKGLFVCGDFEEAKVLITPTVREIPDSTEEFDQKAYIMASYKTSIYYNSVCRGLRVFSIHSLGLTSIFGSHFWLTFFIF